VEAKAIADAARVADRKVTALLHALARTGVLAPRGDAFVVAEPARVHGASAGLVKEAATLRDADRARVRAMMQYAERLDCRWAQVRAHFGEDGAGECARCDVCTSSGTDCRGARDAGPRER